jgi:hypothetical protein
MFFISEQYDSALHTNYKLASMPEDLDTQLLKRMANDMLNELVVLHIVRLYSVKLYTVNKVSVFTFSLTTRITHPQQATVPPSASC